MRFVVLPTFECIGIIGAVPENSKQYYGFTRFAIELNELNEDLRPQLPPTDTRFRPDQRFVCRLIFDIH
jgi:hypothetical protein